MKTAWDFVERHLPNYSTSPLIASNEDLLKLVEKDYKDGDGAHKMLIEDYDDDIENPQIEIDYQISLASIFRKSIEGFISKQ